MRIKPLIFYMNAADYPDIIQELNTIPCDKLIISYLPYPWPHTIARDYFLEGDWTHLIVQPQDLLVKKENYDMLIEKLEKFDYPVLSGVCNVDREGHNLYKWAICKLCPTRDKDTRIYNWVPACKEKIGIMKVGFTGLVFCAIKRSIIERTLIDGEPIFKGCIHNRWGPAPDLNFCLNCSRLEIPIHADTDNRMFHYANHKPNLVNKRPATKVFLKAGEKYVYESKRKIPSSSKVM